jgi:hypothetical protein
MKNAHVVQALLGKRISGVVVKRADRPPYSQLFLIFEDDTYYEFYCDSQICGAGGVDKGGLTDVLNYMPEHEVVVKATLDRLKGPQLEYGHDTKSI